MLQGRRLSPRKLRSLHLPAVPKEFLTVAVAVTGVPYDKTLEERLSEIWLTIFIVLMALAPVTDATIVSVVIGFVLEPQPLSI